MDIFYIGKILIILQFLYNILPKYSYLSGKYCHKFKKLILASFIKNENYIFRKWITILIIKIFFLVLYHFSYKSSSFRIFCFQRRIVA